MLNYYMMHPDWTIRVCECKRFFIAVEVRDKGDNNDVSRENQDRNYLKK